MWVYIPIALLCAVVAAFAGKRKGEALSSFFLGLLLGPIGILIALSDWGGSKTRCPFCREFIDNQATVCAHCRRDLPPPSGLGPSAA